MAEQIKNLKNFKQQHSLEERQTMSKDLLLRHPDIIPVICERYAKSDVPLLDKCKFLISRDMEVGKYIVILRRRMLLKPEVSLNLFVGNTMASSINKFGDLYERFKDEDGFLYIIYSGESTFGN